VKTPARKYGLIVIGTSAGGLASLMFLLEKLPKDYPVPIVIVQHRMKEHRELLEEVLQSKCTIQVKQADEKETIQRNRVYIAPPDYHLLVERDLTFSLNSDPLVRFSRPSIDVLFESAAVGLGAAVAGILLTGANSDGTAGLALIKERGGITIAQDPREAQFPFMPQSAIDAGVVQYVWPLPEIQHFLLQLAHV
jgi:two-component system, chemotaxis family, protein-glutamate methylesterase/glutaminase